MAATLGDLTIVVVTWHSAAEVPPLLASLAPATGAGAELVVIDNASTDDAVALVRRLAPTARIVVNAANRGFGAAANQGLETSRRRFVLFLNPDTVVTADAMSCALAYLDGASTVGVVGCRTLTADGSPQATVDRFHSVRALVAAAWHGTRDADVPRGESPRTSGIVDWVYGSFLLGRRAAFTAVGGFDEAYDMYGEDLDLCHRLRAAGWATAYCAEATVVHHGNRSGARRYGADRDVAVLRGTLRFFRRRRGRLAELGFRIAAGARFGWQAARAIPAAWRGDEAAAVRARRYAAMARLCLDGDPAGRRADRARLRVRHAPGIEGA
jgi:GT2 family glycosyltransferase